MVSNIGCRECKYFITPFLNRQQLLLLEQFFMKCAGYFSNRWCTPIKFGRLQFPCCLSHLSAGFNHHDLFSFLQKQNVKKFVSVGYFCDSRNLHRTWISLTDWLSPQPSSLVNLTSFALWKERRITFILSVNVHCNKVLR